MDTEKPAGKKRFRVGVLIGLAMKSAKLLKALKLLKVLITPLTMFLSILVYGWSLGFWFATGFVLLLFVHEMGHAFAMKIKGYKIKMPIFIPFLGAVIFAPGFKNREEEAFIGFGGPLVGGISALALFGLWALLPQKNELLLMLSYIGIFLNLFNMIPISPMDGGRVTKIIGSWFKWIGVAMLIVLIIALKSPFILLIGILALGDMNINPRQKFRWAVGLELAMIVMIMLGISNQGWGVDVADIAFATLFVAGYYLAYAGGVRKLRQGAAELAKTNASLVAHGLSPIVDDTLVNEPAVAINASAPTGVRMKWLALYLGLTALLIAGIIIQLPHLPAHLSR
ncbi:MAG: hypothetical protein HYW56_00505 [Candidatus Harrisonbacteria bacterium]|nr:hypothetical protein [Candidatus Harrisonbacteria bacterium]